MGAATIGSGAPRVTLSGQPVAVVKASDREILLAPQAHQWAGELEVTPAGAVPATLSFDLSPFAPPATLAGGAE